MNITQEVIIICSFWYAVNGIKWAITAYHIIEIEKEDGINRTFFIVASGLFWFITEALYNVYYTGKE
jgi:hypothetical protein